MSDESTRPDEVEIPFGDEAGDTATLLLAAADKLDLDPGVVKTTGSGFLVPPEVADEAGIEYGDDDDSEPKATAKKAAAKKSSK